MSVMLIYAGRGKGPLQCWYDVAAQLNLQVELVSEVPSNERLDAAAVFVVVSEINRF